MTANRQWNIEIVCTEIFQEKCHTQSLKWVLCYLCQIKKNMELFKITFLTKNISIWDYSCRLFHLRIVKFIHGKTKKYRHSRFPLRYICKGAFLIMVIKITVRQTVLQNNFSIICIKFWLRKGFQKTDAAMTLHM